MTTPINKKLRENHKPTITERRKALRSANEYFFRYFLDRGMLDDGQHLIVTWESLPEGILVSYRVFNIMDHMFEIVKIIPKKEIKYAANSAYFNYAEQMEREIKTIGDK